MIHRHILPRGIRVLTTLLLIACLLPANPRAARAEPQLAPFPAEITLCPGESIQSNWVVPVTQRPGKADYFLLVDTTGDTQGMITALRSQWLTQIVPLLNVLTGSNRFAVAEIKDYPINGQLDDVPYRLLLPFTDQTNQVQAALNQLTASGGGDAPEAYTRGLYESTADPALLWRPDARRYVLAFGTSVAHEIDPGRDGELGTADDLLLDDVLAAMKSQGQPLLFVMSTALNSDYMFWRTRAPLSGFGGNAENGAVSSLATMVNSVVMYANRRYDHLDVQVSPQAQTGWVSAAPEAYNDVLLNAMSQDFAFNLSLSVPADAAYPSDIPLTINTVADHVIFGTQSSTLHVVRCEYATTTQLTAQPNPAKTDDPVSLQAAVSSPKGMPTGLVTFLMNGNSLPGCTHMPLNPAGQATCAAGKLASGNHAVTATFTGSGNYLSSNATLEGGLLVEPYWRFLPMTIR